MEFPNFGKQCSVESCRQLDFLPFSCDGCRQIYCLEHKSRDAHHCPVSDEIQHFEIPLDTKSYQCSLEECKARELVAVVCPECMNNFCMRHRHQQDHSCEKLEPKNDDTTTPKEKVEAIIGRELKVTRKAPKSGKMTKTAAKVALMKMKMHATGDKGIPQTEREYFNIEMPKQETKNDVAPMFFSKKWSVGRIIDSIAELNGLSNRNNVSGEKKLILLNMDDTVIDPSKRLEDVIQEGTIDLDYRRLQLLYS